MPDNAPATTPQTPAAKAATAVPERHGKNVALVPAGTLRVVSVVDEAVHVLASLPDGDRVAREFAEACNTCTPKQLRLSVAVASGLTLAEAYAAAGFSREGGKRWREVEAGRTLRKPHVVTVLAGLKRSAVLRSEISLTQVHAELARVAFSDLAHYDVQPDGTVTVKPDAPHDATRALSGLEVDRFTMLDGATRVKTRVRLHNKVAALQALAAALTPADAANALAGLPGGGRATIEIHVHGGDMGLARVAAAQSIPGVIVHEGATNATPATAVTSQLATPSAKSVRKGRAGTHATPPNGQKRLAASANEPVIEFGGMGE